MSDFAAKWGFPSEVVKTIHNGLSYDVVPLASRTPAGHPRIQVVFRDALGLELERRPGFTQISKRTNRPYELCRRDVGERQIVVAPQLQSVTVTSAAVTVGAGSDRSYCVTAINQPPSVSDVFDE